MTLAAWPGVELLDRLHGGARTVVHRARRGSAALVVRRSGRPAESLDWELDLLEHLRGHGIAVPVTVPAGDGRRHVDGLLVQEFLDGTPPAGGRDWARVLAVLADVHAATTGWPQRPGFRSSRALLTATRGGDVDLAAMPAAAVPRVRAAWRPLHDRPECVVHGDVGAGNVLVSGGRVALLDWDESRVDSPWFDLAPVPAEVPVPWPGDRAVLTRAGLAWEAATCWTVEPAYAASVLARLG